MMLAVHRLRAAVLCPLPPPPPSLIVLLALVSCALRGCA